MEENETQERTGVDRRTLIRRSAVMGGAMVWAVPTVQTLAGPAFAAGSPLCDARTIVRTFNRRGKLIKCLETTYVPTAACCKCLTKGGMSCVGTRRNPGPCTVQSTRNCINDPTP